MPHTGSVNSVCLLFWVLLCRIISFLPVLPFSIVHFSNSRQILDRVEWLQMIQSDDILNVRPVRHWVCHPIPAGPVPCVSAMTSGLPDVAGSQRCDVAGSRVPVDKATGPGRSVAIIIATIRNIGIFPEPVGFFRGGAMLHHLIHHHFHHVHALLHRSHALHHCH